MSLRPAVPSLVVESVSQPSAARVPPSGATSRRLAAALAIALLAGCGGEGERDVAAEADRGPPVQEATSAPDACEMLSEGEVEAMAGEAVTAHRAKRGGPTWSGCEWFGRASKTPYLGLTVYWTGGREQWEIQGAGYAVAKDLMRAAERTDLDSVVKPGPVAGLGDAAVYADLMPSVVLEGDRLVELMLFHLPDARTRFRPLAAKVLERVGTAASR